MATNNDDRRGDDRNRDRDRRVPTQEEYEQETADTRWVPLEDVQGDFKVQEVPPLKLLRDMKKYGVAGLLGGDDEVDMKELIVSGDFDAFLENTVLPNILEPSCYWSTEDRDIGDGDFDLAALTADDLMAVITGMTGQDQDDLQERMDDTFRG
jgi:hypothetical protein